MNAKHFSCDISPDQERVIPDIMNWQQLSRFSLIGNFIGSTVYTTVSSTEQKTTLKIIYYSLDYTMTL